MDTPEPEGAVDARVWRMVGDPLVAATAVGPLSGQRVAVKDLFAVAGHRIGAGNPAWLAQAPVEPEHAAAVSALLAAGAEIVGIARTDEFAYSLAGTNAHYGTPPNPRAPGRVSGGSSSGSASAVARGEATIGLGTDTGGSIRVPAAYQGLYGLRPTHAVVDATGVLALAPRFDTVGWLTRDADTLAAVGEVLLPPSPPSPLTDLVVVPELVALAEPDVAEAVRVAADALGAVPVSWDLSPLGDWLAAFQTVQAAEAWTEHGAWLADRMDTLGPDVRSRFARAAALTPDQVETARDTADRARTEIRELVAGSVLVLPSTSSVAPDATGLDAIRAATMRLTCLAGLAGLPALGLPLVTTASGRAGAGLPCGLCLVAGADRDRDLLELATSHRGRVPTFPA